MPGATPPRRVFVFAGPNGSGKSTLTTPGTLRHLGIPADRYINADDIARGLTERMPDATPAEREALAFRRARALRAEMRAQDTSFAFETVFSHPSTLLDLRACRAAGYEVVVLFVTTADPAVNAARVAGRVLSGGHDVPADRIRDRYERVMRLLPRIAEEADRFLVYDNSGPEPLVFALRDGSLVGTDPVPAYLRQRLEIPLARRAAERAALVRTLGPVGEPAHLEAATCEGPVVWLGESYAAQETPSGLVRHDRLLLTGDADVGASVLVVYADAAGRISDPSVPSSA